MGCAPGKMQATVVEGRKVESDRLSGSAVNYVAASDSATQTDEFVVKSPERLAASRTGTRDQAPLLRSSAVQTDACWQICQICGPQVRTQELEKQLATSVASKVFPSTADSVQHPWTDRTDDSNRACDSNPVSRPHSPEISATASGAPEVLCMQKLVLARWEDSKGDWLNCLSSRISEIESSFQLMDLHAKLDSGTHGD